MKKFIAAAAGLMLAGTMVSTACAAVEVNGDARLRYYYQDNYVHLADSDDNHASTRVRVAFKGTTESGAYAKARVKFNADPLSGEENNALKMDYGFISVPVGAVTVQAGNIPTHITAMINNDTDHDAIQAVYADDMNNFVFMYSFDGDDIDGIEGNDSDSFSYIGRYELTNDMINVVVAAVYADPADGDSGGTYTVRLAQDLGAVSYSVDYAFVESSITGTDSDGHMGYATVGVPTGEAGSLTFVAGMTVDGATMDVPVGFTMIAGDKTITPGVTSQVGVLQDIVATTTTDDDGVTTTTYSDMLVDTWFAGIVASYAVSEKSSLTMTAAYADMDQTDGDFSTSAFEVGANYAYTIAEGVSCFVELGFMDVDEVEDSQFGAAFGMDVKF
jgi:hypothetical protein